MTAPQRSALLVIDMINDFASPGGALFSEPVGAIVPAVAREVHRAYGASEHVIFVADAHREDDPEFALFPPHALPGTGRDIVDMLDTSRAAVPVLEKSRYSAFYGTRLDEILRDLRVSELRLVGNCTNICVFFTAADAANRGYGLQVVRDAVASFDVTAHAHALVQLETVLGAKLI